jgi:hypothetical protein
LIDSSKLITFPITNTTYYPSGNTEPVFSTGIRITLHEGSGISNSDLIANGTCHSCRALGTGRPSVEATGASPMMFAVGPSIVLNSDDLDGRIRRHVAYGLLFFPASSS